MYTSGKAMTHGATTPQRKASRGDAPFSIRLYLTTIEKTGMDETTATMGKAYTESWSSAVPCQGGAGGRQRGRRTRDYQIWEAVSEAPHARQGA